MDDLRQVGGTDVHGITDLSPEVHILMESCQEIRWGAVGGPSTSQGHLHGAEGPYVVWNCKIHVP